MKKNENNDELADAIVRWHDARESYWSALEAEMWVDARVVPPSDPRFIETRDAVHAAMLVLAAASRRLASLACNLVDVLLLVEFARALENVAGLIEIDRRRCTVGLERAESVVEQIEMLAAAPAAADDEPQPNPLERALVLLMRDGSRPRSITHYAKAVGLPHHTALSRNERWMTAYNAAKGGAQGKLPRGSKDADGNLEAWNDRS